MDSLNIEIANQKNKVERMEDELKTKTYEYSKERVLARKKIILERAKLGQLLIRKTEILIEQCKQIN